ncbi:odorant receptor Or1-like [Leguminivora glycinivorella]|uniref:odorant receptor Or1-like n=1 Tax=Leguminivora glycinivorella TaxID=1035111 RepID=UPI00200D6697|nr:odorant receptor Or1-like [Leguminivora glycinivorella]
MFKQIFYTFLSFFSSRSRGTAMKNSDCLSSSIAVMKYSGVWMPDNLTHGGRLAYIVFRYVTQTVMFFFIILAEIAYVYKHRDDSERMVDAAVLLMSHLVQAVKLMTIIVRQERIKRLIALGDGPAFTPSEPQLKAQLERAVKLTGLVGNLILVSAGVTAVFWFVVPALKDVLTLPLKITFPFDVKGQYIFAVMYFYTSLSVVISGVGDAAENFLVSGVLTLASTQVGLLHEQLLDLKGDGKQDKDCCYKKAVLCVKFHQRIIEYVEEIAKIFGMPIFCQCVTSSIVVCMTVYKITITQEPVEMMTMIFYLLCVMMELLMYCFPADVLINKSLQISDAAYPEWSGDVRTGKVLLLTALRAQRALVVNAGGMFRISLPTAAAVVQTSYTYYALLQQKLKKE